jgi:hypothetical protein
LRLIRALSRHAISICAGENRARGLICGKFSQISDTEEEYTVVPFSLSLSFRRPEAKHVGNP